jgi:hypothetical protein
MDLRQVEATVGRKRIKSMKARATLKMMADTQGKLFSQFILRNVLFGAYRYPMLLCLVLLEKYVAYNL